MMVRDGCAGYSGVIPYCFVCFNQKIYCFVCFNQKIYCFVCFNQKILLDFDEIYQIVKIQINGFVDPYEQAVCYNV